MKIQTASLTLYGLPVVLTILKALCKTPTGRVGTAAVVVETDSVTYVNIMNSVLHLDGTLGNGSAFWVQL